MAIRRSSAACNEKRGRRFNPGGRVFVDGARYAVDGYFFAAALPAALSGLTLMLRNSTGSLWPAKPK